MNLNTFSSFPSVEKNGTGCIKVFTLQTLEYLFRIFVQYCYLVSFKIARPSFLYTFYFIIIINCNNEKKEEYLSKTIKFI